MGKTQRRGRLTDSYVDGLTKPGFHRDGLLPGFGVRVGRRKRSFELRIERRGRQKIFRTLGTWPVTKTDEARAAAHDILAQFERKEPIKELRQGETTIAIAWPLYRARLIDEGASPSTLDGYKFAYARLSEHIRNTPLRELAANPVLMADEVASIRKRLRKSPRGGQAAASQSARLVSALFSFAQRRDPTLLGNPVSAVATADPKRHDLPALATADMPAWWRMLQEIPREHHREAHLFTLLSGLRRQTVVSIQWQHVDLKRKCIRIERPKGGPERGFDLILSRAMIRCLWRARRLGRRLYPEQAKTWVFAGPTDHVRGDALTKDGIMANHSLRRGYAVAATNAGVDEQTVGRLLNHGGKSITSRYIPSSHIGRMLAGAQEDTSIHIVEALGSPHGMT